jgi:hypothetical protein
LGHQHGHHSLPAHATLKGSHKQPLDATLCQKCKDDDDDDDDDD